MRYMVVLEKGSSSYGAFVPDLPGCIAVGETEAEALMLIEEAIHLHIEDMKAGGRQIPQPRCRTSRERCVCSSLASLRGPSRGCEEVLRAGMDI